MIINKIKFFLLILIFNFTLISCSSVQKALDPQTKNSSEEFLVEKKSPLSMPPDFDKLPVPQAEKNFEQDTYELEDLIKKNEKANLQNKENKNLEFEELILDQIKNN